MARDTRLTLSAPLIALGTTLKFRSQKNIDIVPLVKFTSIPTDSILVNIRIPTDDWNIEIFRTVPEEIPINYYMHSVFMDGDTYNLNDMLNMKPEDFQAQITIRTWDYMPEREDVQNEFEKI